MSEVLKGLYAYRANLERRIAAASANPPPDASGPSAENAGWENKADLQVKLGCVVKQIDVYVQSGMRWHHSTDTQQHA